MAPLDTAGWAHNAEGEIVNGQMRCSEGGEAYFKHSQELRAGMSGGCGSKQGVRLLDLQRAAAFARDSLSAAAFARDSRPFARVSPLILVLGVSMLTHRAV